MKNNFVFYLLIISLSMFVFSCTKLNEEKFGSLSPDNYYVDESTALSSVVGIYQLLAYNVDIGDAWRMKEYSTDEFITPGRASGGWFDQSNIDLAKHEDDPDNNTIARAWTYIFQEIGTANAVIESLEASPFNDKFSSLIAEAKALRAYGYFYAMDNWGNVPLVTVARLDPNDLPGNTPSEEIYRFIENEMLAAVEALPAAKDVNHSDYYPRFTKESIYTALAYMYLNAETYTGTAQWAKTIEMCDKVINSNAFDLMPNVVDNFTSTKQVSSTEIISAFTKSPSQNAGGNQFILYTQNGLDQLKYNLPFAPANGYSTTEKVLNLYEDQDERKQLIEYGPQFYLDGVTPLRYPDGTQLVLIPVQDIVSAQDNEGYKVLKYTPIGASFSGFDGDNDLILERYSNILLMKAEASLRLDDEPTALSLINQVRKRSQASELTKVTLKDIEDERVREFLWEGCRRTDMIRFGSYFSETWPFKTKTTEDFRKLYPIPNQQRIANPNLDQNPGY